MTIPEQETDLSLPREEGALHIVSAGILAVLRAGALRQGVHMSIPHLKANSGVHSGTAGLSEIKINGTCHTVTIGGAGKARVISLTTREKDAAKGPFSLFQPSPPEASVSMASRIPVLNSKHLENEPIVSFIYTLQYSWQSSSLLIPISSEAVSTIILG